jgi:uncharacterized protein YjiS (DUF1127 family)
MDLLNHVRDFLKIRLSEEASVRELKRLDDRSLADLGISRTEIRGVARAAARRSVPAAAGHEAQGAATGTPAILVARGLSLRAL